MSRSDLLINTDNNATQPFRDFLALVGIEAVGLAEINAALQQRYFKTDSQTGRPLERWEYDGPLFSTVPDDVRDALAACGFVNAEVPRQKEYTYYAWPGALAVRAAARMFDLIDAWKVHGVRCEQLVAFGGKRPLQLESVGGKPAVEGLEAILKLLHADHDDPAVLSTIQVHTLGTELQMMEFMWDVACTQGDVPQEFKRVPALFVDAPMKQEGEKQVRPNTEDTILEWLKGDPKPGSILLSSGAPYSTAQEEAFRMLLPAGFTVETFGHGVPAELKAVNMFREVAGAVYRIKRNRLGV